MPIADIQQGYDTSNLEMKGGKYTKETIEKTFEGQGRKTAGIVSQVVEISTGRRGVMFFASTIQHAKEVLDSLPPDNARLITGATPKTERELIILQFKSMQFKYLVNVSVLTTGFDAPHVDVVAILRATESAGLLQQIIGRGLRLFDGKENCLVLDFAENIERHDLEDDLFNPEIRVAVGGGEKFNLDAECPSCSVTNVFAGRPNKENFNVDANGYFVDLAGDQVMEGEQPMPAHFGRRCQASVLVKGLHVLCDYRWSFKACPACDQENDIAARYCTSCKGELVDPNEKLKIDFKRMKSSPRQSSSDKVVSWFAQPWTSQKGNESLRIDWTTEYRTFSIWYTPEGKTSHSLFLWHDLCDEVFGKTAPTIEKFVNALQRGHGTMPTTITSKKEGDFFKAIAHGQAEDVLNEI